MSDANNLLPGMLPALETMGKLARRSPQFLTEALAGWIDLERAQWSARIAELEREVADLRFDREVMNRLMCLHRANGAVPEPWPPEVECGG